MGKAVARGSGCGMEREGDAMIKVTLELTPGEFDITNVTENIHALIVFKWQERIRKALGAE